MTKKIYKNEQLVLDYLNTTLHRKINVSTIASAIGITENEVNQALTYLDQNTLLPDVCKIRCDKWGNSTYQLMSRHTSINDIARQIHFDSKNLRRDVVKLTKKLINSQMHPQVIAIKTMLAQVVSEMNNSFSLAIVQQLPSKNI